MSDTQQHFRLSIHEARELLRSRQLSSRELTQSCLERIEATEPSVHALITVCAERALAQSDEADKLLSRGEGATLMGIPYIAKDVLCTEGVKTTCGSRILESFVPPYSATVIRRLDAEGAVLLGKANMDEFAMGSSTEHSAFFPTHNPWNLDCVPGGSSGGSAAATASEQGLFALGSDTGGSIRQPAGFCGVVGLKPTYGRVSRFGLVAFGSSLDQIGPFTKDVEDCALVMNAISGQCEHDSTSAPIEVPDFTSFLSEDIRGLKIGVPREYFIDGMDPEVRARIEDAISVLERLGASVDRDVSLPSTQHALAAYYIIAPSEASANLARFDGVKYGFSVDSTSSEMAIANTRGEGFGDEVKRRIMLGTYALSSGYYDAYYLKAQKVRYLLRQEFDQAFARYDILVTPTSPTVAFPLGSKLDDPMQMYLSDVFTLPINIAGIPAITVPSGYVSGLPVGMQLMGNRFREDVLLRAAYAYQKATDWHLQRPRL
ncbi:MAG: Asp-tRNA(Asn)/Glu-tRNA(Gln) amidotransferase subunit GatA [Dehalococcoidia bacterium]|nr:Asp-tRNA(Asn)/Glu-tRNA(Gln) amidotransferase subunit GatA [Dehalococcoidia bacterium]